MRLADLKQHPSFEVGRNNWMSKLKPLGILGEEATAITTMKPSARSAIITLSQGILS